MGARRAIALAAVAVTLVVLAGTVAAQTAPGGPPRGQGRGGGSGSSGGGGSVAVPIPEPGAIARRWLRPDREMLVVAETAAAARPALDALAGRDYTIMRRARLAALGLELAVLQGPRRADLAADAAALAPLHPAVSIGPNLRYARLGEAGAGAGAPSSPRALVGAGAPDPECGRGLRLGMLDLLPNPNARPLRGVALEIERIVPWGQRLADDDHGTAEVVNLSFGGPPDAVLARVAAAALEAGALLVAAAGNDGPDAAPVYPAALAGVVAVTAVDVALDPWPQASSGPHVALAAPGVDLYTAGEKHRSGTSFAAPFATAALALARAQEAGGAAERVLAAAWDLGPPGRDPTFGAGLVQLGGGYAARAAR